MSDQFQPDYPTWVTQIFDAKFKCNRCGRRLKRADLTGLGVARPQPEKLLSRGPKARAFADCSKCGKPFCFEVEASRDDIVEAVAELFDHIELFGEADDDDDIGVPFLPSPNFPDGPPFKNPSIGLWSVEDAIQSGDSDEEPPGNAKHGIPEAESIDPPPPDADMPFDLVPNEKSPAEKRRDSIRRRKKAALKHPPTDEEVARFLKRLHRTSFKRSSKGWANFMRQFGVDIHWPGGGA